MHWRRDSRSRGEIQQVGIPGSGRSRDRRGKIQKVGDLGIKSHRDKVPEKKDTQGSGRSRVRYLAMKELQGVRVLGRL